MSKNKWLIILIVVCGLSWAGGQQKDTESKLLNRTVPGMYSETITIDPGVSRTDPKEIPRQIFVGTGGNIYGWLEGDDLSTPPRAYKNVNSGQVLSYCFKRFTGKTDPSFPTTASDITAVR